jgi:hypothetical protein
MAKAMVMTCVSASLEFFGAFGPQAHGTHMPSNRALTHDIVDWACLEQEA